MQAVSSLVYRLLEGQTPLIVSLPHVGTQVPPEIERELTPAGRALPDTDWYVDRLYDFAAELGANLIAAQFSRYVIDLNRPPDGAALYPGQANTGLCPTHTFAGEPIYGSGVEALPAGEVTARRGRCWQPYHDALAGLIDRCRRRFGYALLLDAHSIRSYVPRLFTGRLPDINLGTDDGRSCKPEMILSVLRILQGQNRFSHVLNGRFLGGYITRHYGAPASGVHALQIELAQAAYMDENRAIYEEERAAPLRGLLLQMIEALMAYKPAAATG